MTAIGIELGYSAHKHPRWVLAPTECAITRSLHEVPVEELALFHALHISRSVANTSHARTIAREPKSYWWDLSLTGIESHSASLPESPAVLSKRVIRVQANTATMAATGLVMRINGFPFFGETSTAACLTSMLVANLWLRARVSNDPRKVAALDQLKSEMGGLVQTGIPIRAQVAVALELASRALVRAKN